jgi:hypothetical protein
MIWIHDDLVKTPKKLSTLGNLKDTIKKKDSNLKLVAMWVNFAIPNLE